MARRKDRYYVKFFTGEHAFTEGLEQLKSSCPLANRAITDALSKAGGIGVIVDFLHAAWPGRTFEKLHVSALAMQALLTPALYDKVSCNTSFDGLLYRTNSTSLFGWRRLKDGTYIFMVMPGSLLKQYQFKNVGDTLLENGWKFHNCKVFDKRMRTVVNKMTIQPRERQAEHVVVEEVEK